MVVRLAASCAGTICPTILGTGVALSIGFILRVNINTILEREITHDREKPLLTDDLNPNRSDQRSSYKFDRFGWISSSAAEKPNGAYSQRYPRYHVAFSEFRSIWTLDTHAHALQRKTKNQAQGLNYI